MTYIITGYGLTVEDVVNVARNNQKVELHKDALEKIKVCRKMVEDKIANKILAGELKRRDTVVIGENAEFQVVKGREL